MTPNHWMTNEGSGTVVFPFLSLQGALLPSRPTAEREMRAGVDGIGLWLTGARGEPFQIQTILDCVSAAAAASAFAAYLAAIHTKKDLYYCSLLWGTIVVHDVVLVSIQKFGAAVGGIQSFTGGSGAILTAAWTIETLDT
jgi:hypothetical protein